MSASGPKSLPAIGFLTVVADDEHGLFGGYLVLNAAGRPREFHCTAPVKANRAQEILYGPTLDPFLYGEQIGQTLLKKAKEPPLLVCTDVEPAMEVRDHVQTPVMLIEAAPAEGEQRTLRVDRGHALKAPAWVRFEVAGQPAAVHPAHADDQRRIVDLWLPHAEGFDLREPFERIREAIAEAKRGGKR